MIRLILVFAFTLFAGSALLAHPLPNLRYDRTIDVRLTPGGVTVNMTLELNEWTLFIDGKTVIEPREADGKSYAALYLAKKGPLLADGLRATMDTQELTFKNVKGTIENDRDHLVFRFEFRAETPFPIGKSRFSFVDTNFQNRSGKTTLTLDRKGSSLEFLELEEPEDLRQKSPLDYKPGDEERSRRATALVLRQDNSPKVVEISPPMPPVTVDRHEQSTVTTLFDGERSLFLLLLLAFGFGAAHAFTPGHGKTMVAAYLVGEQGTFRHAILLGLTASAAHTGSVILVAIIVHLRYGDEPPPGIQGVLTLVGGFLVFGVGLWLLLQRLRNRADHFHFFGSNHHHGPDGSHSHEMPPVSGALGWWRVVLLGVGGGLIPCWDAVLLFLIAIGRGKAGIAIPLLIAFGLGLATTLVLLGVIVVRAGRAGSSRFGESRWFRFLPIVSALLLVGIGISFARDGWKRLAVPPAQVSE